MELWIRGDLICRAEIIRLAADGATLGAQGVRHRLSLKDGYQGEAVPM